MEEKELYLLVPLKELTNGTIGLIGQDTGMEPPEGYGLDIQANHKYCDEVVDRYLVSIEDGQIVKEYIEVS